MAGETETAWVDPADVPGSFGVRVRGEDAGVRDIAASIARPPVQPEVPQEVTRGLAGIQRREIDARSRVLSGMFSRAEGDADRARRALDAEGIGPHDLTPWNADQERRKYETDPIQSFGSVGSVFATIAAAFTRQPMVNALNGSAAAMQAIKDGNEKEYERSYRAWKDNNELVVKRHSMMHQNYQDAVALMQTDLTLGTAKMQALATQYGDQKALFLLEHGMSKELFEMMDARSRAVESISSNQEKMDDRLRKNMDLQLRMKEAKTPQDAVRIVREWHRDWDTRGAPTIQHEEIQRFREQWRAKHGTEPPVEEEKKFLEGLGTRSTAGSADQAFIKKYFEDHPAATSEEFSEAFGEYKKGQRQEKTLSPDQEFVQKFYEAHPEATPEEFSEAFGKHKKGQKFAPGTQGGGVLTLGRQEAAEIERRKKENEAAGMPPKEAYDKAVKDVKAVNTTITGNRREQLEAHVKQYENALATIDKVSGVLERYVGAAGIAGRVTRTGERLTNMFGASKQTDRVQFMRDIEYLKALAPQLLLDRAGRPLSAEAAHVNDIVAGLSMGDTTANTLRAMKDLKALFRKMRVDLQGRIGEGGEEKTPIETPSGNWWESYPAKPRSEVDGSYQVAGDVVPGPRPASSPPYRITPVGVKRINQGLPPRPDNENLG